MNKYTRILVLVVTCLAVGYFSSLVTRTAVESWFPTIQKPSFNPPNWLFAPVWTTLYIMMGIAGGLVWHEIDSSRKEEVKKAMKFFAIQLALNALWSYLFFGLKNPLLALVEIVLLWLMIYETYIKFVRINKFSGYLFVPYLLWVSFATVLNASIWWLNQ
ncbi:tryptophan-rich sensory protein [Flavobacterium endophyticum]|uniref:Tryptophan-rich sensory protein n=1 Tax=Flavobacterium endophyticum TaxID=1540163 RepID=A0A495MR54_9FLAO|nr:TspO/MBR family protein [Flavobacterium endophyticum]RKS26739.1 tryptophan-rich sensory protein [Flavobacterium endophyticum]